MDPKTGKLATVANLKTDAGPDSAERISVFLGEKNWSRRHLTTSQRGTIAVELVPLLAEEARKRELAGTLSPNGDRVGTSTGIAAQALGVGHSTVERAARVKREKPAAFDAIKARDHSAREITIRNILRSGNLL